MKKATVQKLTEHVLELIRLAATSLPPDVEKKLRESVQREAEGSAAQGALQTILQNVALSREKSTPICQDTGTPIFYVYHPEGVSTRALKKRICAAVAWATELNYLRPNAVDSLTGENSGNNIGGEHYPYIHFEEVDSDDLMVDLMLKGGGCENVGAQYKLPDGRIGAARDLEGVRRAALDAVHEAQGRGCAPGVLGIAVGGDRGSSFVASKEVLFRKLDEYNPDADLAEMEARITAEANQMGVGPMGFGGNTTVLDAKMTAMHRLPASYFVTVSYMCWAFRRRRMVVNGDEATYE